MQLLIDALHTLTIVAEDHSLVDHAARLEQHLTSQFPGVHQDVPAGATAVITVSAPRTPSAHPTTGQACECVHNPAGVELAIQHIHDNVQGMDHPALGHTPAPAAAAAWRSTMASPTPMLAPATTTAAAPSGSAPGAFAPLASTSSGSTARAAGASAAALPVLDVLTMVGPIKTAQKLFEHAGKEELFLPITVLCMLQSITQFEVLKQFIGAAKSPLGNKPLVNLDLDKQFRAALENEQVKPFSKGWSHPGLTGGKENKLLHEIIRDALAHGRWRLERLQDGNTQITLRNEANSKTVCFPNIEGLPAALVIATESILGELQKQLAAGSLPAECVRGVDKPSRADQMIVAEYFMQEAMPWAHKSIARMIAPRLSAASSTPAALAPGAPPMPAVDAYLMLSPLYACLDLLHRAFVIPALFNKFTFSSCFLRDMFTLVAWQLCITLPEHLVNDYAVRYNQWRKATGSEAAGLPRLDDIVQKCLPELLPLLDDVVEIDDTTTLLPLLRNSLCHCRYKFALGRDAGGVATYRLEFFDVDAKRRRSASCDVLQLLSWMIGVLEQYTDQLATFDRAHPGLLQRMSAVQAMRRSLQECRALGGGHDPSSFCHWCRNTQRTLSRCAKCKQSWYCSLACQKSAWKTMHKTVCRLQP